ncbi:MAG: cysteine hydrolase [Rhodocyclaceae bacterium]|jgi:nicotinamidase-related amidase|nr:Peroxyureidoacrylate/ureidoacrylate amidohydrolase RutB [Rhodocyclaceae bacterium]MCC6880189.1 cysteine hydrolase [Rhodocyclaceae bacterium]MCL4681080.1 cysteine hydrolase [Rhodocyclaceae bacterium]
MTTALILIDLQNDYFPGGTMELVGAEAAVAQAARLLQSFRQSGLPVFHVQHIATRPGATFFLPGTPGAEIHAAVRPNGSEPVVVKHFPNSFRETALLESLRAAGATKLVFAGMMTHMCVDSTVRAAADLGFPCALAADACATRDLQFGDQRIEAAGVQLAYLAGLNGLFARVQSTDELCAER